MEKTVKFNGISLFIMMMDEQIMFKAKDVTGILDYARTETALKFLDEDEKLIRLTGETGQKRKTWFVTESGLYHLIIKSTKPNAVKFRKWLTSEVLPAIRKTGSYDTGNVKDKQEQLESIKAKLDTKKTELKEKKAAIKELQKEVSKLEKEFWEVFGTKTNQLKLFSEEQLETVKFKITV